MYIYIYIFIYQGVIQKNFGVAVGSTKKCYHDCDQALRKSSWRSV